jgi:GNAT superfamily N-acetyltransferase
VSRPDDERLLHGLYGTAYMDAASAADLPRILTLFDDAVAWLNERGIPGQWGSAPFSQLPQVVARFGAWIEQGTLFVARVDGEVAATAALNDEAPAYVLGVLPEFPSTARYLEGLISDRHRRGQGLGADLLRWVEDHGRAGGATVVWLDCWAESRPLCAFYEAAGYTPGSEFVVGSWHGRLFEKALA